MQNTKQFFYVMFSALATGFSSLGVNKVISIYFGPQGIALLAHFQNLITLFTQIPNEGVNKGLIKILADTPEHSKEAARKVTSGIWIMLFVYLLCVASYIVFQEYFVTVFSIPSGWAWHLVFLGSIFFFLLNLLLSTVVLSYQHISIYSSISILGSFSTFIFVYLLSTGTELSYVLIAIPLSQVVVFAVNLGFIFKSNILGNAFIYNYFSKNDLKLFAEYLVMALGVFLFGKLIDFVLRAYIIDMLDLRITGIWQSVVKISDSYLMLAAVFFNVIYYPKMARMFSEGTPIYSYSRSTFFRFVKILPILFIGLYFLRGIIVQILFSEEFSQAADFFLYQLIADFFRILSWCFAFMLIAEKRISVFLITEAMSALLYLAIVFPLSQAYQVDGLLIAYLIRYVLYFLMMVIVNKKIITA